MIPLFVCLFAFLPNFCLFVGLLQRMSRPQFHPSPLWNLATRMPRWDIDTILQNIIIIMIMNAQLPSLIHQIWKLWDTLLLWLLLPKWNTETILQIIIIIITAQIHPPYMKIVRHILMHRWLFCCIIWPKINVVMCLISFQW